MLLSYAVRYFLPNHRAGHIKLDPTIAAGKVVLNVNIDLQDTDAIDSYCSHVFTDHLLKRKYNTRGRI